jgi:hypothetical protein
LKRAELGKYIDFSIATLRVDALAGNMGHARGAAAVRLASQAEPELEARMAEVNKRALLLCGCEASSDSFDG